MAYYVSLKQFEGPLDLLLHLISKAKVDIKDIFVDGIFKIVGRDYECFGKMLEKLDKLTGDDSVITFTVSADEAELPKEIFFSCEKI